MKKSKKPNYPKTPMKNCLYCKHYNEKSNTCTAPGAEKIANFNPKLDADCLLFKYSISESPQTNEPSFVAKYCVGTKCPLYYSALNICTKPSACPYSEDIEKSTFEGLNFDKEL